MCVCSILRFLFCCLKPHGNESESENNDSVFYSLGDSNNEYSNNQAESAVNADFSSTNATIGNSDNYIEMDHPHDDQREQNQKPNISYHVQTCCNEKSITVKITLGVD